MARVKSQHDDDVEFVYKLNRFGWSDLIIIWNNRTYDFCVSHVLADPTLEIIGLCNALLDGQNCFVSFFDEPGTVFLDVAIDAKQRHLVQVRILESLEDDAVIASAKSTFSVQMKLSQFLALFICQFEKLSLLCREKSYAADRPAFPYKAFEDLRQRWLEHDLSRSDHRRS